MGKNKRIELFSDYFSVDTPNSYNNGTSPKKECEAWFQLFKEYLPEEYKLECKKTKVIQPKYYNYCGDTVQMSLFIDSNLYMRLVLECFERKDTFNKYLVNNQTHSFGKCYGYVNWLEQMLQKDWDGSRYKYAVGRMFDFLLFEDKQCEFNMDFAIRQLGQ